MPIPPLDENGLLPAGVHDCTVDELESRFGLFTGSGQRPRLMARLTEFLAEARQSSIVRAVLVDGSFVTAKAEPGDVDLVLVLRASFDRTADLLPREYSLVSRKRVRSRFGFDTVAVLENSAECDRAVAFFQQVRGCPHLQKGILRLLL